MAKVKILVCYEAEFEARDLSLLLEGAELSGLSKNPFGPLLPAEPTFPGLISGNLVARGSSFLEAEDFTQAGIMEAVDRLIPEIEKRNPGEKVIKERLTLTSVVRLDG